LNKLYAINLFTLKQFLLLDSLQPIFLWNPQHLNSRLGTAFDSCYSFWLALNQGGLNKLIGKSTDFVSGSEKTFQKIRENTNIIFKYTQKIIFVSVNFQPKICSAQLIIFVVTKIIIRCEMYASYCVIVRICV